MYTNIELVEAEEKSNNANAAATATVDGKAYNLQAIKFVNERIDAETFQTFAPLLDTRSFDATSDTVDWYENVLMLDYPLLAASGVTVNGTALTLWDGVQANKASANYTYRHRRATPYYDLIGLKNRDTWSPSRYGTTSLGYGDYLDAIEVTGTWGYRTHYATEGWRASGDTVQNNPLSSSATSITVTDADGVAYDGTIPRFSPGMLLQIESEWLTVESVNTSTNILTVIRGARGSTAASHAQATAISAWFPEPNIQRAATRWASYLYNRRAVYQTYSVDTVGGFVTRFPLDVPEEVRGLLDAYVLRMFRGKIA